MFSLHTADIESFCPTTCLTTIIIFNFLVFPVEFPSRSMNFNCTNTFQNGATIFGIVSTFSSSASNTTFQPVIVARSITTSRISLLRLLMLYSPWGMRKWIIIHMTRKQTKMWLKHEIDYRPLIFPSSEQETGQDALVFCMVWKLEESRLFGRLQPIPVLHVQLRLHYPSLAFGSS